MEKDEIRDIELAYHFPERISRESRARLARWGALFILGQIALGLILIII